MTAQASGDLVAVVAELHDMPLAHVQEPLDVLRRLWHHLPIDINKKIRVYYCYK